MRLDRLLIEKIENRILVGITAFVGMMVIIGWIAINEEARMAAFANQFEGRSIERGAYQFNQNCSECHGIDGRGLTGIAPGLNSPHLFGRDFLGAVNRETELLNVELEKEDTTEERRQEIEARLAELESEREDIIAQMQPAIDNGYDPDEADRMGQVEWEGTTRSYVYTTLVHGRPGSLSYWPQAMASWGQVAGGPLRDDQLEDVVNYVMNWDKGAAWTIDDLNSVNQFAKLPADPALLTAAADPDGAPIIGTDIDAILADLPNYTGDPINGQQIYNTKYACAGCHSNEIIAPLTETTWSSATAGTGGRPYAGDPTHYVVESIVMPNEFIAPGYNPGAMPQNFNELITMQELADIIAYVSSYDEGGA
jgi:mono/diheme cytochrome c family protein